MTFFGISLAILILAQCGYSMAFVLRFEIVDSLPLACCCFCALLPFGSLVAFCMFLASEDCLNFGPGLFRPRDRDSALIRWIKTKLNKHLGFILEAAIEAFPQSLLQIIAIVYYQEANYISIISILLSMLSVMSKSLILSQGLEKYTFIWTWLWYEQYILYHIKHSYLLYIE